MPAIFPNEHEPERKSTDLSDDEKEELENVRYCPEFQEQQQMDEATSADRFDAYIRFHRHLFETGKYIDDQLPREDGKYDE